MLQLLVRLLDQPVDALVDAFGLWQIPRFGCARFEPRATSMTANISSQQLDRDLQCSPTSWADLSETDRTRHRCFYPGEEIWKTPLLRRKPLCQTLKEYYTPKRRFDASCVLSFPEKSAPQIYKDRMLFGSMVKKAIAMPKRREQVLVKIASDSKNLGNFSGSLAAATLRETLRRQPRARLVIATGSSQFEVLKRLTVADEIDWSRVDGFHLDEYLGLDRTHPASFCGYLASRFVDLVPIGSFHFLNGKGEPESAIAVASQLWSASPIDLAMIGIGENGHLAFNDPPADFETTQVYHVVKLDEACRQQQVGEGWFPHLDDCPSQAISMTVHAILQSRKIICSVPDSRKADAVALSVDGPLTPKVPASILRQHHDVTLVLDESSASKLSNYSLSKAERV